MAFRWLGQKANMLMTGRTHSKWSIVDDIVYACGGVNMDHESLANIDYMFRFDNKVLADKLSNEQYLIARADKARRFDSQFNVWSRRTLDCPG